ASPAATACLRPERPARAADGRARLAAGVSPCVPVKIAVRLPNWLGDTVMAVPALRAIRAKFPEARVLLAGPWVERLAGPGPGGGSIAAPRTGRPRCRRSSAAASSAGAPRSGA